MRISIKHPIEELFDENIYTQPEKCKTLTAILQQLNRAWNQDVNVKEITKDDLIKMIGPHRNIKDAALVEEILNILLNAFSDPKTLPIVISNLGARNGREWATILAGLYGKKARRAIPWIRYHLGGQVFPDEAELALNHIGMSQKILYTGLRIAIQEADAEGFLVLLDVIKRKYPSYKMDPEFEKILDAALRNQKDMDIRRKAVLILLSEMPIDARSRFKSILQRLANDKDDETREIATKLLNPENL